MVVADQKQLRWSNKKCCCSSAEEIVLHTVVNKNETQKLKKNSSKIQSLSRIKIRQFFFILAKIQIIEKILRTQNSSILEKLEFFNLKLVIYHSV